RLPALAAAGPGQRPQRIGRGSRRMLVGNGRSCFTTVQQRSGRFSHMEAQRALHSDSSAQVPAALEGFSLPGWIYRDADFLEAEKERVFATSWQVVCHLNDIPNPGDYHTLDFIGEPLVAVRGQDRGV